MASCVPVRLAYKIAEPASGVDEELSPVIFLHGCTTSKEHWCDIPQLVANGTNRKVYALDARNHGDSVWSDDFNFDINVDDLFHFMDSFNIPKAILIGHSMGGITAIKSALAKPERVEKIVVEDMYTRKLTKITVDVVSLYITLSLEAIKNIPDGIDEVTAKRQIMGYVLENLPPELNKLGARDENSGEILMLKQLPDGRYAFKSNMIVLGRALKDECTLMSENKGSYAGPACFIYGELSPFRVGDEADHIRGFFPNAKVLGVNEADHSVHTDSPQEFTDLVLKFISEK